MEDVGALGALGRALDVAWWGQEETDDADVLHGLQWADDLENRTQVLVIDGRIVGSAAVMGQSNADLAVAPWLGERDRRAAYDQLLDWLVGADAHELDAPRQDTERLQALQRHGFRPMRSSFELEMAKDAALPEPPWPAGVSVRPMDIERDPPLLHELIYSVWTDVPGHAARPFEEWRHLFLGHADFDPAFQVLAWRDDRLAGAAVCRLFGGTDGWLSQLVVGRADRGLGLGRALLCEALGRMLATPGVELVGLSVMAANEQALGLYVSVGLQVDREFIICAPDRS